MVIVSSVVCSCTFIFRNYYVFIVAVSFVAQLRSSRGIGNDVSNLKSFPNLLNVITGKLFIEKCTVCTSII